MWPAVTSQTSGNEARGGASPAPATVLIMSPCGQTRPPALLVAPMRGAGKSPRFPWRHATAQPLAPPLGRRLHIGAEARDALQHRLHLIDSDEPRALELARRVLMTGAIHEILVV